MKITDKSIAVVTGGAQGIGLELCKRFVSQGAKVVLVDICDTSKGDSVVNELNNSGPGKAKFVRKDMTKLNEIIEALNAPKEVFGSAADIVILNAGIVVKDHELEKVVKMIELNTTSMVVGSQIAADLLKAEGKHGVIINTASMAGLSPVVFTPAYAASKWAVVGYTLSTKFMRKTHNVRINCICPTLVDTPAVGGFFKEEFSKQKGAVRQLVNNYLTPQTVADAFLKIIDDDSLHASAVAVLPEKTFVHDPDFPRVLGQVLNEDVPDYVKGSKL